MKIRPYHVSDEDAVVALWRQCGLLGWSDPRKDIARKMKVNPEWFLVGESDRGVVATCMAGYDGHRGWIYGLAVAGELRRGGHGRALVTEAEKLLGAAGCPKVNLLVRTSNAAVIGFYERLGFKQDAVVSMGKRLLES